MDEASRGGSGRETREKDAMRDAFLCDMNLFCNDNEIVPVHLTTGGTQRYKIHSKIRNTVITP